MRVGLKSAKIIGRPGVRKASATALFKDGNLSLARLAQLADMPLANFIAHVSRLGLSVTDQTADEVQDDLDTLDQWPN